MDFLQDKFGAVGLILSLPVMAGTVVTGLVAGINEAVISTTLNGLQTKDDKYVAEAQKQILMVKTAELISNKQLEGLV